MHSCNIIGPRPILVALHAALAEKDKMKLSSLMVLCLLSTVLANFKEIIVVPSCDSEGSNDADIDGALRNMTSNEGTSGSTLVLLEGCHRIRSFMVIQGLSNVGIVGNGTNVTVTCELGMGLAFYNISNLTITGVEIVSCGLVGDKNLNTVLEIARKSLSIFYSPVSDSKVSLFVADVVNLYIANVSIADTQGIGMLAINIMGSSVWEEVLFINNCPAACITNNSAMLTESVGGGLFFMYTDYVDYRRVDTPSLVITNSQFEGNQVCASSTLISLLYLNQLNGRNFTFAGGAAAGIVMAATNFSVNVRIENTKISGNSAITGMGIQVAIFQGVQNSSLSIIDCTFINNSIITPSLQGTGALSVASNIPFLNGRDVFDEIMLSRIERNTIEVSDTIFAQNTGAVGTCIYFYSTYSPLTTFDNQDIFRVRNCTFNNNMATAYAPVMLAFDAKYSAYNFGTQLILDNVLIKNNTAQSQVEMIDSIITMVSINVTLTGSSMFTLNQGSSFLTLTSFINVEGNVTFKKNSASRGGALQLLSNSALIIKNNSNIKFIDNRATSYGGAIYADLANIVFGLQGVQEQDCFLYFLSPDILCTYAACIDPTILTFNIEFEGNRATLLGRTIYGSTLSSCSWYQYYKYIYEYPEYMTGLELLANLPDDYVTFSEPSLDETNVVNTILTSFDTHGNSLDHPIRASPGEMIKFNVTALDALNQSIPSGITSVARDLSSSTTPSNSIMPSLMLGLSGYWFLSGSASGDTVLAQVKGKVGTNISMTLASLISTVSANIYVELQDCGYGLVLIEDACQCIQTKLSTAAITCNQATSSITVREGYWIGQSPVGYYSTGECIFDYCTVGDVVIYENSIDSQCANNRAGVLCGGCRVNYSIVFGSSGCRLCDGSGGWITLLVIVFLLLGIVMIVFIALLDFTVTKGYLYGIIFYSNVLYVLLPAFTPYGNNNIFILIAWINFDTGISTCTYKGMDALAKTGLSLLFPFYLFLLMLIIIYLARRLKKLSKFSAAKTFATLLLLCYSSVSNTCFQLLGYTTVEGYQGDSYTGWIVDPNVKYGRGWHGVLVFVAVSLILVYILPFSVLLFIPPRLLYTTRLGHWISVKFKPISDAFWSPLKDKFTFWIGFRCVLRMIPLILSIATIYPINVFGVAAFLIVVFFIHILLKPFKKAAHNNLETFFMINLLLLMQSALYSIDLDQGTAQVSFGKAYIAVIITTTYMVFVAIIGIHFHLRFPKILPIIKRKVSSFTPMPLKRFQKKKIATLMKSVLKTLTLTKKQMTTLNLESL